MIKWFLNKLDQCGRKLVIHDRDGLEPYLIRYYLVYPDSIKRERKDISFNAFLHQFMRSDDDVFHTHPWDWYTTIVLKGGYWAHTPWGTKWYGPGSIHYQNCIDKKRYGYTFLPTNLHWVEIPKPGQTWTLFTRGRTVDNGYWGFCPDLDSGEIIEHNLYLDRQRKSV